MSKKEMPKAYEPAEYENEIYKNWEMAGHFNPDNLNLSANVKSYTIVLPPPNVTGTLHMGHAGMLAFEDILIRYHRMKGERALWVPGTDHAAIATQTKVEKIIKEEGETRHTLGREKFLERVAAFAQDSHDTIVNQCKKMGASLDWSREAYTLDETRNKAVNSVFKLMYDDGLIYRGERIVNWCPRCHSTLADDEVEYKETKSKLYFFKYSKDFPITIATTRPETKLGDTALAVNPRDERYQHLIGKEFELDFVGVPLKIKIITDREVDMEFGAGALGVTPAHSAVDWAMAEKNDLEIIKVIDEDGKIKEGFGEYSNKNVKEARAMIVENLKKAGLLEKEEEIDNNLSICYRCDTPIEPLPSLQWFMDVNKKVERLQGKSIKETCLESVKSGVFDREKINLIPERFEKTYFHWMENLRDWCISRQIWYGHQVPVWYRESKVKSQKSKVDSYVGVNPPEGEGWVRDEDTLDTWFSAGMWTFSTLAQTPDQIRIEDGKLVIDSEDFMNFHPTQVLETGYDILFFWVARMIIMTTYSINDVPFEDVYLHGLVLDEKGKKMSKSKGNVIDPLDMIAKYGTDATRLSLVSGTTPGNDIRLSEEKVAGFRNMVNKLWNVGRCILQNQESGIRNQEINTSKCASADVWIMQKMTVLIKLVTDDLENYRFSQAGERLREFTWNDLADWYLEATKFLRSDETEKILNLILSDLLKLWHPFIPFVTEVIRKEMGQDEDLIISHWPQVEVYDSLLASLNDIIPNQFKEIIDIISVIRNARAENMVEPSRKVKAVIEAGGNEELLRENEALIKGMRTGVESIEYVGSGNTGSFDSAQDDSAVKVVVGDVIVYLIGAKDEAKEKERVAKRKVELEKVIKGIKNKLDNKNFMENAPEAVVNGERERLAGFEKELGKLEK